MPISASPLIDSTNRLLGWSTNDFSMYGALPATTIGAPGAAPRLSDGLSVAAPAQPAHDTGVDGANSAPLADLASPDAIADVSAGPPQPAFSYPASSPLTDAGTSQPGTAQAIFADAVVLPTGAGSASSVLPTQLLHAGDGVAPLTASSLSAPDLGLAGTNTALSMLSSNTVADFTAPVFVLDDASVEGLVGTTANVVDALHHVTETLGDHLVAATDTVGEVLPAVSDLASGDHQITAADGFTGSDPAGGVTTLVGMVDSADAFDLAHVGAEAPVLGSAGSILDSLVDDPSTDSLLGDAAHHADDSASDHHDDGVLGIV